MGARKHPYIRGDAMLNRIENTVIRKYSYEHKITIMVFWITHFLRTLDKLGKFWYNIYRK